MYKRQGDTADHQEQTEQQTDSFKIYSFQRTNDGIFVVRLEDVYKRQ